MYCFEGKLVHFPGYYQEALVGRGIQFPKNNAWRCAYRIGTWKKLLGIHGECQWNVKNTRKEIDALHDSKELTNSCEHVSKFTAKDKPVNFGGRHYGWLPQPRRLASTDKALPTVYSPTFVCKRKLLQLYLFIRSDYWSN